MPQAHDLRSQLARQNSKLDRCSLVQRRNSLCVRATFPGRSDPRQTKQTSLSLGLQATPEHLRQALALAREIDDQLMLQTFSWDAWSPERLERRIHGDAAGLITMAEFRAGIEATYAHKYPDTERSWATVWGKKYQPAINLLARMQGPCTQERLITALGGVASLSARKTMGSVFNQTIAYLRLGLDPKAITAASAGYNRKELQTRVIPSDQELLAYWNSLELPHWRWMFGMVLAYGIRPHEIVNCTLKADGALRVPQDTKTGSRLVRACPEEWIEELQLQKVCRPSQTKEKVAKACSDYLRKHQLPVKLYDARHAYAIRLLKHGITADVGAQLMGHSVEMHTETYRYWITESHMSEVYARIGHKFRRDADTA